MTHAQHHHQEVSNLLGDMLNYVEYNQKSAMFDLLLQEFCDMDIDETLRTFMWLWEDPKQRSILMIAANAEPHPKY